MAYPASAAERARWILERRGPKRALDPRRPYGAFLEREPDGRGGHASVATVLITNRECPWRCAMCDLWTSTLDETVPPGAIVEQVRWALEEIGPARWIKLYNAGSFFDPRAIPPQERRALAPLLAGFERVIVECHPALAGEAVLDFRDSIPGRLEVALGLETAHPAALERLEKQMTADGFASAARRLGAAQVDVRAFLLVGPPFVPPHEADGWLQRSLELAWDCGVRACALIPTRGGNGALEALAAEGAFVPPRLADLERALERALAARRSLVFADPWDLERFADCSACFGARRTRLERMNWTQALLPAERCAACGHGEA
jgi:radical SAM enzyme (TIGR01210 family)